MRKINPNLQVGAVVKIYAPNSNDQATGNIATVSKTGKKVTVITSHGVTIPFYRDDRLGRDHRRYTANPGAGLFGRIFNDYFMVNEIQDPG